MPLPMLLLVEDDPGFVRLVTLSLEAVFRLDHVSCLADALVALDERNYVGIILDLNLRDSKKLTTLWRVLAACNGTPVLAVSGQVSYDTDGGAGHGYVLMEKTAIDWGTFADDCRALFLGAVPALDRDPGAVAEEPADG